MSVRSRKYPTLMPISLFPRRTATGRWWPYHTVVITLAYRFRRPHGHLCLLSLSDGDFHLRDTMAMRGAPLVQCPSPIFLIGQSKLCLLTALTLTLANTEIVMAILGGQSHGLVSNNGVDLGLHMSLTRCVFPWFPAIMGEISDPGTAVMRRLSFVLACQTPGSSTVDSQKPKSGSMPVAM